MTPRRPFLDILNSLPLIKAALAGALALAPLFLPDRLIPEQLSALRVISTIVVIIAVFVGWKYHRGLRKRLGTFIVTGAVALIGLTIMQLLYVEAFVGIGQPPETEYHLIGYAVSPAGEAMLKQARLEHAPLHDALLAMGPSAIPALFGRSYTIMAIAYGVCSLLLVFSLAVVLVAVETGSGPPSGKPATNVAGVAPLIVLLVMSFHQLTAQVAPLDSARILDSLALAAYGTGVPSQQRPALDLFRRAERFWLRAGSKIKAARDHGRIGVVYSELANDDSALVYYVETIARQHRLQDTVGEGRTHLNRGNVFLPRGDFDEAVREYRTALAAARLGHDSSDAVYALYQLGWAFQSERRKTGSDAQGDSAAVYYRRLIAEAPAAGEVGMLANGHERLGSLFEDWSQPDSAIAHYETAIALYTSKVNAPPRLATALFGLGSVYASVNRNEVALGYLRRSSRIYGELEDTLGKAKVDFKIAAVEAQRSSDLLARGKGDTVIAEWKRRSDSGVPSGPARHTIGPLRTDSLRIAKVDTAMTRQLRELMRTDLALAEALFLRQLARAYPARQTEGQSLSFVAHVFMDRDSARSALIYLDSALNAFRVARDRLGEVDTRTSIGWVHQRLHHNLAAAAAQFDTAAAVRAGTAAQAGGDINRVSLQEQDVNLFSAWALTTLAQPGNRESSIAALGIVERGRAQALLALLGRTDSAAPVGKNARVSDHRLVAEGNGVRRLVYWLAEDTLLVWWVDPNGKATLARQPLARPSLLREMAPRGSQFSTMGRRTAGRDTLARLVEGYRAAVTDSTASAAEASAALGHALANIVLPAEILQHFPDSAEVVVVPFGALGLIPFAALPLPNGEPLGSRYAIRYAPSLNVLNALLARSSRDAGRTPRNPLIVGNPNNPAVPDARTGGILTMRRLPNADSVARWLGRRLNVDPLIGDAATERAVRERIGSADLIDFGTHGYAYSGAELARRSFITLTPTESEDGVLTVADFLDNMPPLRARLVVFGACETGLGDLREAEGVVGLARAVLARGADGVLITLWNVDDRITGELLRAFYDQWLPPNNHSTAEALQLAQVLVRRKHPEPRLWAAFQFVGR